MESIILPCKTIILPEIPEKPTKFKTLSTNLPPKLTNDAYYKKLCQLGRLGEAVSTLESCRSTVSQKTLSDMIQSCIHSNSLDLCHKLHDCIKKLMKGSNTVLENQLVGMFAKCGSLYDAFAVFDGMCERNLYTWSTIIGACSRERKWGDVVELFYCMMADSNIIPDAFLFPKILEACGNIKDVKTGKLIHGIVIKLGMTNELRVNNSILAVYAKCGLLTSAKRFFKGVEVTDTVSWNSIITGYCKADKISEARRLFDAMHEKGLEPNVVTWNVLISRCNQLGKFDSAMELMNEMESHGVKPDVYTFSSMILSLAQNNRKLEAIKLFVKMLLTGVKPNGITLMSVITACSSLKDLRKGKEVHLLAIKLGYDKDVLVGNSLIDMYSKCGKLEAARLVFDMIPEKYVCTWNSLISGFCQAGYCGIGHDLFKQMQESNVSPNVITWNVMITGYIQNGDEDEAMDLFHRMEKDGGVKRNAASWNALIAGYLHHGEKNKALRIFQRMQYSGIKPNSITILSILPACANLIALKKLKEIHCCVLHSNLESDVSVANSLIDVYAKCGNIKYSNAVFEAMPSMDIITWNSMMTGYVLHGYSHEAIDLFERMRRQGYAPNRRTFASIITAYGLSKKVEEGRHVFSNMTEEYKILPCLDHYVAMVNLYGRSGKIDEAFEFIRSMPIEPDISIWSAFLTASCKHGNLKLAIHAGMKFLELEPDNSFVQRLVIHLYDLSGILSNDSLKIKGHGIRKYSTGMSLVEHKSIVHGFVSGDLGPLDGKSLHSWIESIELRSKDLNMISIEEERAGIHSEKLALAFALIKTPPHAHAHARRSIRVVKNLSMCNRCHVFAKLVSKIHVCEIYIRDSKCLHHFKDGVCCCGDYW